LLGARHQAEQTELGFALVLPEGEHSQVHQLLSLTGLDSAFAIYEKLEDALAAVHRGLTARAA
jgi:hypothetical protein